MLSNTNEQNFNLSLLQKLKIERRTLTDDIHPLSLIIMDVSHLSNILSKTNKQNEIRSTILKMVKNNTRKTDIVTCIHKSTFALFLPNTPESGVYILSERLCKKIEKVLSKNNFSIHKKKHILLHVSTYLKTDQGKSELKALNKQYK